MSWEAIQAVIGQALVDREFREQLLTSPAEAIRRFDLDPVVENRLDPFGFERADRRLHGIAERQVRIGDDHNALARQRFHVGTDLTGSSSSDLDRRGVHRENRFQGHHASSIAEPRQRGRLNCCRYDRASAVGCPATISSFQRSGVSRQDLIADT